MAVIAALENKYRKKYNVYGSDK